ncbi:MAG TPA: hypothetical protein VKK79_10610 [Candidatus Lokiarchaeia archaeon]|nr:hypothetical protein [Candidatus Lokiarchaeia archaeon]
MGKKSPKKVGKKRNLKAVSQVDTSVPASPSVNPDGDENTGVANPATPVSAAATASSGAATPQSQSSPQVAGKQLRQVSYFKLHDNGRNFVRTFVPEVEVRDHELYIYVGGEVRVLSSSYFIPEHLEQSPAGDVIFMFMYDNQLYPLPRGRSYFDEKYDLQVRYPPDQGTNISRLVANHPDTVNATIALNNARDTFMRARDAARNFSAGQSQFLQKLSPLTATGASINQVPVQTQTSTQAEESEQIPILPASGPSKKPARKKSRKVKKDWDAKLKHILAPD